MNGPVLILLAILVGGLLAAGGFGMLGSRRVQAASGIAAGTLAGLAVMLALVVLLLPGPPATLTLPVGLPGAPLSLALDPLGAGFLLLLSLAGTAVIVFAVEAPLPGSAYATASLPIALAGLLLAVLAADGITLALGLALGGGALWASAGAGESGRPSAGGLAVVLVAGAAVIVALALLAPAGGGLHFAAVHTAPPGPARATLAVLVAVIGLGALLGLAPLHRWVVPAHGALPAPAAALLSGGLLPTALYALLRIVLDLGAPAAPLAAGVPLLLGGAASVLLGGWGACRATELDAAAASGTLRQTGMAAFALGMVAVGRAADLPDVAALALSAVLLLAAMQAVCGTLGVLAASAICRQAGTRRLDRMGGLAHRMPVSTAGLLAGLAGLTGVPPAPGFAALFLLVQAVLVGPRTDGLGMPLLLAALILVLALGSVLAAAATVRLVGTACLGRPRVPRAAASDEVPVAARPALLGLAGFTVLLGVLPGPVVRLLSGGAIRDFTGGAAAAHLGWLKLTPGAGSPGYAPLPLMVLLLLTIGSAVWVLRRHARRDARVAPVWQDGFAPPPPWLPFGDPVTQWNGAVFLPPTPPAWRWPAVRRWLHRARRHVSAPALALGAAGLLLVLLAWPGRP